MDINRKLSERNYAPGFTARFANEAYQARQAEQLAAQDRATAAKLSYLTEQHEYEQEQMRLEQERRAASIADGEIKVDAENVIPIGVTNFGRNTKRFILAGAEEFRDKYVQKTASDDQGGFLGTSFRSEAARIAGLTDVLMEMGEYDYADEYQEKAQFGLGVSGRDGEWGNTLTDPFTGMAWAFGAAKNYFKRNLTDQWWQGGAHELQTIEYTKPDGTVGRRVVPREYDVNEDPEDYRYAGFAIGSPLWTAHNIVDPNFTEEMKKEWVNNLFGDEYNKQLSKMAGITPADIMNAKSPAAAAATIAHKRVSRLAGAWYEQSSRTEATMAFLQNLGATMVNDPDMQAEMAIGVLSMGVTGIGSVVKGAGSLAVKGSRTLGAIPHGTGMMASMGRWSGSKALALIGKPLEGAGVVTRMTGGLMRNLNPWQVGERILLRTAADIKWLRRTAGAGVNAESKALAIALKTSSGGAGTLIAKEVLLGTSDVTWKSGVIANMIDGAAGNFAAYASTRDEHYLWERNLYGETYDASKTDFHWFQGGMHSGAGSIATGALFGMAIGGAIRGLGLVLHDQKKTILPSVARNIEDMDGIEKWSATLKEKARQKAKQNAGEIGSMMLDISGNGARKLAVAGGLVRQSLRRAGVTAEAAFLRADQILQGAQARGVDIDTAIRKATDKAGRISMKALKDTVEALSDTPRAKQRRKALRVALAMRVAVDGADVRTAHALNTHRMDYMIENEKDIGDDVNIEALDVAIERSTGQVKEDLITLKNNINILADEQVRSISDTLTDFGKWENLTADQKVNIMKRYMAAIGREDVDIDVKSIDEFRAKLTVERLEIRRRAQRAAFDKSQADHSARMKAEANKNALELEGLRADLAAAKAERDRLEMDEVLVTTKQIDEAKANLDRAEQEFTEARNAVTDDEFALISQEIRDLENYIKEMEEGLENIAEQVDNLQRERAEIELDRNEDYERAEVAEHLPIARENLAYAVKKLKSKLLTKKRRAELETLKKESEDYIKRIDDAEAEYQSRIDKVDNRIDKLDEISRSYSEEKVKAAEEIDEISEVEAKTTEGLKTTLAEKEAAVRQARETVSRIEGSENAVRGGETKAEFERRTGSGDLDLKTKYEDDAKARLADEAETDEEAFAKVGPDRVPTATRDGAVEGPQAPVLRNRGEQGPAPAAPTRADRWQGASQRVDDLEARIKEVEAEEGVRLSQKAEADKQLRAERVTARIEELKAKGRKITVTQLKEMIRELDPDAKIRSKETKGPLIKRLAELENREADSSQQMLKFTEESKEAASTALAIQEVLGPKLKAAAIGETTDGIGVMVANKTHMSKLEGTEEAVSTAALRSLFDLRKPGNADARGEAGNVLWNAKIMGEATAKRAEAIRQAAPDTAKEVDAKLRDNPIVDKKKTPKAEDVKKAIRKEFGIDLTSKRGESYKAGLTHDGLIMLYRDLTHIRTLKDLPASVQKKLGKDLFMAVAVGEPGAQKTLARAWYEAIIKAEAATSSFGQRVPLAKIAPYLPEGFEGMLHTTFAKMESRDKGGQIFFDLREMRLVAEQRLAMADDQFRKAYLVEQAKRVEEMDKVEAEYYGRISNFDNESAMTDAFNARRTEANASVDHAGRVYDRHTSRGLTDKQYEAEQRKRYVRGVIEGWDAIPQGAAKDALANRLGILDYTRDTGITDTKVKDKRTGVRRDDWEGTGGMTPQREAMADALWNAAHEQVGLGGVTARELYNGELDSAWGYTVGRALIEAVSGSRTQSHQVRGMVDVEMKDGRLVLPEGGFLGRVSNENFAKLYQQHIREQVQAHVLGLGTGTTRGTDLKHMTADDVEFILRDIAEIERIIDEWKDGDMPEALSKRLNNVGYDPTSKERFSPKEIVQDLHAKIGNFKERFDKHVRDVLELPPSVINMLHDEGNVVSSLHASMHVLGDIPNGAKKDLRNDISGDAGLEGGVFTAGSWKDIWTHRSSEMFGSAQGLAEAASLVGLRQLSDFMNKIRKANDTDQTGRLVDMLEDLDRAGEIDIRDYINNSVDASAQAVTMGQAIFRDFITTPEGQRLRKLSDTNEGTAKLQEAFSAVLQGVRTHLEPEMNRAGEIAEKFAREGELGKAVDKYADEAIATKDYDKYSDAGLAGVEAFGTGEKGRRIVPGWDVLAKYLLPEEGRDVRTQGELGAWARKELFKPPVMTITYGAGAKAFRANAHRALDQMIAEGPERWGMSPAEMKKIVDNKNQMVEAWVDGMLGSYEKDGTQIPGIIQDKLGLPTSQDLIKIARQRTGVKVKDDSGNERTLSIDEIISSDIWEIEGVVEGLMNKSNQYFPGLKSIELGLWVAKLELSGQDFSRSIKYMADMIDEAITAQGTDYSGSGVMGKLEEIYQAKVGYMTSLQSNNRLGFHSDSAHASRIMDLTGADLSNLTPMARESIINGVPLYQATSSAGAQRKFGTYDGSNILRNRSQETDMKHSDGHKNVVDIDGNPIPKDRQNIGQTMLADAHKDIFGTARSGAEFEERVKSAVLTDMLTDLGSVITPPSRPDGPEFRLDTLDDFYQAIYAQAGTSADTYRGRQQSAMKMEERIAELKKQESVTEAENFELVALQQLLKSAYGRDKNGNVITSEGSGLIAAQMNARSHFDVGGDGDTPTSLGVSHLQTLNHRFLDQRQRQHNRDTAGIEDGRAFTSEEVLPVSPIDPEWMMAARADGPYTAGDSSPNLNMPGVAQTMAEETGAVRTQRSIDVMNEADSAIAEQRNTTVEAVRLNRMLDRIEAKRLQSERAIATLDGEQKKAALLKIQSQTEYDIIQAYKMTTGRSIRDRISTRNPLHFDKKLKSARGGGGKRRSVYDAVANAVVGNASREMTGWLMGPSPRAGLDMRLDSEDFNILPQNQSRGPMAIFAMDYQLMGGSARDYVMITAVRIADAMFEGDVGKAVRHINENGFMPTHEQFFKMKGYDMDEEGMARNFKEAQEAKALISEDARKRFNVDYRDLEDQFVAELGAPLPHLVGKITPDEAVRYKGVLAHLEANPDHVRFIVEQLPKEARKGMTAEKLAVMFSLSREKMAENMKKSDAETYQPFMPRHDKEGNIDDQELDFRNGVELQTHVVDPKASVVFTPAQMLVAMNMGSNRAIMDNLILSSQLGLDIDMNARLDARIKDSDNPFGGGTMRHGFAGPPMDEKSAAKMVAHADVPNGATGRTQYGANVMDTYGMDKLEAEKALAGTHAALKSEWFDNEMVEAFGIASMIHRGGLSDGDKLSKAGEDLLKKADMATPEMRSAVVFALGKMQEFDAKRLAEEAEAEAQMRINENSELALDDLASGNINGKNQEITDPIPRGEDRDGMPLDELEDTTDHSFVDTWVQQADPSDQVPLVSTADPRIGNAFSNRLKAMSHKGNEAAGNAGRAFDALTGRDGINTKDRIGDDEAMALIEMSYLDVDLRNAVWGGRVDFSDMGATGVQNKLVNYDKENPESGNLYSKMTGLAYVKKQVNNNNISAGAYLLLHEMIERLDVGSKMRALDSTDPSAIKSSQASQINRLYIENFGTKKSRAKFKALMERLGLWDNKMNNFIDAAAKLSGKRKFSDKIDEGMYKDRESMRIDAEEDAELRNIRNEGFTQILTMALFSKQLREVGDGVGFAGTVRGAAGLDLGPVALSMRAKFKSMQDYINQFSFKEPERNVAAKGEKFDNYSWSFVKEGRYQNQVIDMIRVMDESVHYGQPFSMTRSEPGEQHGFSNRVSTLHPEDSTRYWGGVGDADGAGLRSRDDIDAEIGELMSAMSRAEGYESTQIQIRLNELNVERGLGESFGLTERLNEHEMAKIRATAMDEAGLIDLSKVDADVRTRIEDEAVDGLLDSVDAMRSSGVGRAANRAAGIFSSGHGVANVANSSSSMIRALGALVNPEMVNTRTMTNQPWISDQVAMDNMASDFHNAMQGLKPFRDKGNKLNGEERQKFNRDFSNAMENRDAGQRRAGWAALGYKEKQIMQLEGFHQHLFRSGNGLIPRLAKMMAESGMISKNQADVAATKAYLPKMVLKELADAPGGMQALRKSLAKMAQEHLVNKKDLEIEALDGFGFFMNKNNSNAATQAEFEAMPAWLRTWYQDAEASLRKRDVKFPDGFDKLSAAYRTKWVSNFIKDQMSRPMESRSKGMSGFHWGDKFTSHYRDAVLNDRALASAGARDETGKVVGTRVAQMAEAKKESMDVDVYSPTSVMDMLAQREAIDLKTGGKLGDSRIIGDRQAAFARDKTLSNMEDTDTMNRLNSVLGSSAVYSYATVTQQHGAGVKGMNTTRIIQNLRRRSENNEFEMSATDKTRFEEELNALEDQLRTGYNQRPKHVKNERTTSNRALMALSRIGVSTLSAGNFTLSALVEVFGGMARSMGNLMRGDLKALTDYMKMLSPAARARMMENANGFELSKIHMGINTRLGDLGFDDLEAMRGVEESDWVTGLEKAGRKMTGFAMMGFGAVTEYSRAIAVAQGVRRLQRIRDAKGGGFEKLGESLGRLEVEGGLPRNVNEAVALARQFGIQRDLATHLYQNGQFNARDMIFAHQAMQGNKLTDEGLLDTVNYPGNGNAVVKSMLQHINSKLNLDPRMGNRQIPSGIVEQLLAVLGQFPLIFYSRMRQAAYQGGALGVAGFLLPMLLGEIYYSTLQQAATGEKVEDIWERWSTNPQGALLNVLENMNVLGGSSFVLSNSVPLAVRGMKSLLGNDEMLAGYKESFFSKTPGPAGLSMLYSGAGKLVGATEDYMNGNVTRGNQRLSAVGPIPVKQVLKMYFNSEAASDPIGQRLTAGLGLDPDDLSTPDMQGAAQNVNPDTVRRIQQDSQTVKSENAVSQREGTPTGPVDQPMAPAQQPMLSTEPGNALAAGDKPTLAEDTAAVLKDLPG